jgi:UDP-N-acetylglucosamine diphosphorylase/glucosamine-1-phosphate N-acetyltransferase
MGAAQADAVVVLPGNGRRRALCRSLEVVTALLPIALFDDGLCGFGPLSDLRASFDQRIGILTGVERARRAGSIDSLWPEASLAACTRERHPSVRVSAMGDARELLCINGACADWSRAVALAPGEAIADSEGALVACRLAREDAARVLSRVGQGPIPARKFAPRVHMATPTEGPVRTPWDLLNSLDAAMRADAPLVAASPGFTRWRQGSGTADSLPAGVAVVGDGAVGVHESAHVWPGVVIDATGGPVVIGDGAVVRPCAVLVGPVAVLEGSTVAERSLVKARSVIGPSCKVGGEIGSCVFHAHSNKVHDGHLGDAIVGEWVNIGAGTCNSNLLNTYGEVMTRLDLDAPISRTGRTFYGCTIGDHVKIAILTAIGTGTSIGTGAMVAVAHPPQVVGRFAWLSSERSATFRWPKFEEVMRAAMARRGAAPGTGLLERLRAIHANATAGS